MKHEVILASTLWLLGCPAPVQPVIDAGTPSTISLNEPAPVLEPEPAVLLPCTPGWQEVAGTDGAPSYCEPWAAGTDVNCGVDQARFAGEPACRLVGTACTSDPFATGLPASSVLFVDPAAAVGGSGTRAAPFKTIAAAMTAATSGTTIALSKGTFTEAVRMKAGVALVGACVAQTLLNGPGGTGATVTTAGLGSTLKNLRVGGPGLGVMANLSGNSIQLSDLIVDGAVGVAILVGNRAVVTGHDVVVRHSALGASGTGGRAISAEYGGLVTFTRAVFEDNAENGINVAEPGSKVSITDGVIRGTRARADGAMGRAVSLRNQGQLDLTRVLIEQNHEAAVLAGTSSTLHLTDVLVRDTQSSIGLGDGGDGLVVEDSATATLNRVAFVRNRALGIAVRSRGQLTATHLLVLDTAVDAAGGIDGAGLDLRENAQITVENAFIGRSHSAALGASGCTVTLRNTELKSITRSTADDASSGLQVKGGASVTVERVRVSQSERVGVLVDGASGLLGSDLAIMNTQASSPSGSGGSGLVAQGGSVVDLTRVSLTGNRTAGLEVLDATVTLADLTISDITSDVPGIFGRGVHLQNSQVRLTRARISRTVDVGVMVGLASHLQAFDLRIEDVGKRACTVAGTCADLGGSSVVVLSAGSAFEATGFSLARSLQCGIQLAEDGVATLSQGEVVGHVIGACVMTPNFDVNQLSDRVEYRDNERKLDAQSVPLPTLTIPPLR